MKQTQALNLRLGQQLTMTPQLQQAIRLLQLSTLDLQGEIRDLLDSNPMLEVADESDDEPVPSPETANEEWQATEAESETIAETTTSVVELDESWGDEMEWGGYENGLGGGGSDVDVIDVLERCSSDSVTLADHLIWQLELTPFSDRDQRIALMLIDAIDERGYLSLPPEEAVCQCDWHQEDLPEEDEVLAVLHRIQRFDPPGVGARTPAECLLLQLEQYPQDDWCTTLARKLVDHLDLLAARDLSRLQQALACSLEALLDAMTLVQSLNPHPGAAVASQQASYVIPDVLVSRSDGRWRVELNSEALPRLRVNRLYSHLMRHIDGGNLRTQLQEARWFLKSLQNRNQTLLSVAGCIIERQQAFLERGEEGMRPLVLRDVAELLGMHESTISRVTTQKYMHTPRGIYEFKYFFSSQVGTTDGNGCSSIAVQAMIRKLIHAENPQKPLSDSQIASQLEHQGIRVARRTVAKYRESMDIPSSTQRRHPA